MSISGSLEDVSVADVMQFIHLGKRTGTLLLRRGSEEGMIGFHEGRLISTRSPSTPRLGDLLVESGLLEASRLDAAIAHQESSAERRSLGQILIGEGYLEEGQLREVISQQIEQTVSELVNWQDGSFEFAVDDLAPVDEIALYPSDVVPGADINTQMVLLEAARIFDERNRDDDGDDTKPGSEDLDETHPVLPKTAKAEVPESPAAPEPAPPAASQVLPPPADPALSEEAQEQLQQLQQLGKAPTSDLAVLHLVSSDLGLMERVSEALPLGIQGIEERSLEAAGQVSEDGTPAIVLVDLRDGQSTLEDIARMHRLRPRVPVLALVDRVIPVSQVYGAGALAALPAEGEAIASCVQNVLQSRRQLSRIKATPKPGPRAGGVARLRRVFGDLRSGLLSATVALNLMHIISESVERAVLFLVRHDCLHALGAFGSGSSGKPLAELTRGMRLPIDAPSVLADSLSSGETLTLKFNDAVLPERLKELLGRPTTGEIVVFPVLGARRVISVIYTDNGPVDRPIEDIEILELATAQVGMAFENELLRRQISKHEG